MALDSLEMTLVSKRYPETEKPYIYFENNRVNSGDGNLNWRLQIWQDVYQDLNDKNKLISGYGYSGAIPAMERVDRAGLDGTNIHVHNYFVNILARGGLVHVPTMSGRLKSPSVRLSGPSGVMRTSAS